MEEIKSGKVVEQNDEKFGGLELVDVSRTATTKRASREKKPNKYVRFICRKEILDVLLSLPVVPKDYKGETVKNGQAYISRESFGYIGKYMNGPANEFNKVFVAGQLPLYAKASGKDGVIVRRIGQVFDPDNYVLDMNRDKHGSETAYHQPTETTIAYVQQWLIDNGYVESEEESE